VTVLEISRLSKTYPNGVRALDEISLDVGKGMFGLLGPNGAGKSTLMRTVATLQAPDSGSIYLTVRDGRIDAVREKDRLRRVLGYLPQEFGVYPRTSPMVMLDHLAVLKGIRGAANAAIWWSACCTRPTSGTCAARTSTRSPAA
jgi:ABC-2 type transport system ATP-binding protein